MNSIWGTLFVPEVVEDNVEIFGVFLFIPHQKLLSWVNGSKAMVQSPLLKLECHQVLLLLIMSTIHISHPVSTHLSLGIYVFLILSVLKYHPGISTVHSFLSTSSPG